MNRWTPAERDGTRQTIRFPSMKFLRTKANTLFFQPEPSDFNFELASQRGSRHGSHPSLSSTKHQSYRLIIISCCEFTRLPRLHLTGMRRICNHRSRPRNNRKHAHFLIYMGAFSYTEKCINFESYIYIYDLCFIPNN